MRLALLAVVALLLAAPPARANCPDRVVRVADDDRDVTRSAVVACVRGRRVVARRAVLRDGRGTLIGGASAAGHRVAWIETRLGPGRRVVTLVRGRVGRRLRVRRTVVYRDRSRDVPGLDVQLTPRGELAWLMPWRRGTSYFNRVMVDLPGRKPREVAYDAASSLALEDGFTLRWAGTGYEYGFHDLPRPRAADCPVRARFRTVASTAELLVSRRAYPGGVTVHRACARGSGRDHVLLQTFMSLGHEGSETASVAASTGTTVAFRLSTGDGWVDLASFDARTGRGLRRAEHVAPPGAVAVTADGVVAWTAGDALLATGPDDEAHELDRGAIADLRADGALLRWSRDGAPRSADPP